MFTVSCRSFFYPYVWERVAYLERKGDLKDSIRIEADQDKQGGTQLYISDMKSVDKKTGKLATPKPSRGFAFSQVSMIVCWFDSWTASNAL